MRLPSFLIFFHLLLLLLLLPRHPLATSAATAPFAEAFPPPPPPRAPPRDASSVTVLVSLLDGSVEALDGASGTRQWAFATGPPLLASSARLPEGGGGRAGAIADTADVIPGADGSLFSYRQGGGGVKPSTQQQHQHHQQQQQPLDSGEVVSVLERLPLTVQQLVTSSPHLGADGSLLIGTQASQVFALDPDTGRLLASHGGSNVGGVGAGTAGEDEAAQVQAMMMGDADGDYGAPDGLEASSGNSSLPRSLASSCLFPSSFGLSLSLSLARACCPAVLSSLWG